MSTPFKPEGLLDTAPTPYEQGEIHEQRSYEDGAGRRWSKRESMNQQEVLMLAKTMGVMISTKPEFEQSVAKFGKQIIKQFRPLTKTQKIYLDALAEPKSLQNLADQFGCTTQNALKMIRALEARKLISKEKLFKQHVGAWSFYYQRKS